MERVAVVYVLADLASVFVVRYCIDITVIMGMKQAEKFVYIYTRFEGPRFSDQNACLSPTFSKTYLHFNLHNFNQTWHNSFDLDLFI